MTRIPPLSGADDPPPPPPPKTETDTDTAQRHLSIQVVGQDLKGNPVQMRLRGWQARIVQHEFDHLEGVLYHDRMAPEQRERVRPGLQKLEGSFGEAFPDTPFRAMDEAQ